MSKDLFCLYVFQEELICYHYLQLLVDILRKVDDSMYPYIGFAVGLIVCKLFED